MINWSTQLCLAWRSYVRRPREQVRTIRFLVRQCGSLQPSAPNYRNHANRRRCGHTGGTRSSASYSSPSFPSWACSSVAAVLNVHVACQATLASVSGCKDLAKDLQRSTNSIQPFLISKLHFCVYKGTVFSDASCCLTIMFLRFV